jgi:hypothetical protein
VKRLLIAVVLLVGCKEEPPIVIKFEPLDAAAVKPAATADAAAPMIAPTPRIADAGVARAPVKKGGAPECKTAADCVVLPVECCDCANGGKQEAVAKTKAAAIKSERAGKCKGAMCTMMVSTDPTCGKRPECVEGQCTMVEKK